MEAKQVPLIERLASVPADARPEQESFSNEAISATQAAWKMGYDAAKAEQPEQEPVQFKCTVIDDVHSNGIPLEQWTTPPQRKPLTDEQYFEIGQRHGLSSFKVEQIHKEIEEAAQDIKENSHDSM